MNFPLVSSECSFFPLSTPKMLTLPRWLPVAMYLESGENATAQASTAKFIIFQNLISESYLQTLHKITIFQVLF